MILVFTLKPAIITSEWNLENNFRYKYYLYYILKNPYIMANSVMPISPMPKPRFMTPPALGLCFDNSHRP
jgi:hypothetical protein